MGFLTGLFANKGIQDMALGTLKKTMKDNGFKFVVIDLMDNGELDIQMYKLEDRPLIISHVQAEQTRQIMQDLQKRIDDLQADNHLLGTRLSDAGNTRWDGLHLIIDETNQSNTLKRDDDNNDQQPGEPDPGRNEKY